MKNKNPLDPEDMLSYIDRMADDLELGWEKGQAFPLQILGKIKAVVVAGMGGSAIAGDMVAKSLSEQLKIVVVSHRDYGLPAWASGQDVLVICSSHSGNTEETLTAYDAALAQNCSVLALTTGGKLSQKANQDGKLLWQFQHLGQPRTALPLVYGLLAAMLQRLGLIIGEIEPSIHDATATLRDEAPHLTAASGIAQNPARRLAGQLLERSVTIFAAGDNEVIARRWKTQINELAKAVAAFEALPEMNHNTLAGLEYPEKLLESSFAVFLRSASDNPRNALRLEYSQQACMQAGMGVDAVWGRGKSRLAQMWTLVQFGDYLSYYMALQYGVDPTPVAALGRLKEYLAGK